MLELVAVSKWSVILALVNMELGGDGVGRTLNYNFFFLIDKDRCRRFSKDGN